MKYLLLVTCLALSGCAYAQEPVYTPMKGNYKFKGLKADTLLLIPSFNDTTAANATYLDQVAGAMIRCGNDFWMRNAGATAWLQNVNIGSGASPIGSFVKTVFKKANTDSVFIIKAPNDTNFAFKDMYIDTIYRKPGKDSIFWKKNGFEYKIKDSTGLNVTGTTNFYPKFTSSSTLGNSKLSDDNSSVLTFDGSAAGNGTTFKINTAISNGSNVKFTENGNDRYYIGSNANQDFSIFSYFTVGNPFLIPKNTQRILINDATDDNTNAFQVNGNIRLTGLAGTGNRLTIATSAGKIEPISNNARRNLNLSTVNDTIKMFGTYMISTADSVNTFFLPNASNYAGMTIYIINKDSLRNQKIGSLGGSIYDASSNSITKVYANKFAIFTSDGTDWFGFNTQ